MYKKWYSSTPSGNLQARILLSVDLKKGMAITVQVSFRPRGFHEVDAPRFRHNQQVKVVSLSALRTGRFNPPPPP